MPTNTLEIEKNEMFELAYRFVTETGENIFLTGKAGTGKTTFLRYLKNNCTKNLIVAAPTGVAAINAGGVTLHSLFQLPFHPFLPTHSNKEDLLSKMKYNKQRLALLRKMEVLVIDEISMVRCDTMDAIDTLLKSVRRNYSQPFGGVQLLCIGDLHQLPPVAQNHEWNILQEYYASPFFFDSLAVKEQQPVLIELNKIYRQKEESFVNLLNQVRINKMTDDDFEMLNDRYIAAFRPAYNEKYITLTSHNNQANIINNSEIQKLSTPSFTYEAEIKDEFPESMYPADASLMLKKDAQVMFIKNDVEKRYFNGKIGVVSEINADKILVDCDGIIINVGKDTWDNNRYRLSRTDGKLEQEVIGTFTQYPLRLAWAITIHKSQGLTFDKVMIDAASAFSSGQVYVALSRCTSLGGIVLLNKIPQHAIKDNELVVKGQQNLLRKGTSLSERFEISRQLYTQQLLEETFLFNEVNEALLQLQFNIDGESGKLNNGAREWIANILHQFTIEKNHGEKFIRQINTLLKDEPVVEKNLVLQKRINDAAKHFLPKFDAFLNAIKDPPIITEHKDAADKLNEHLLNSALALHASQFYLQYCNTPFSVTTYLQHKLNYAQVKFTISVYASKRQNEKIDSPNPTLYSSLKKWRDDVCESEGVAIFMIASHATLKEICTYLPKTKRDLLLIDGFGKIKVDKYGGEIIEIITAYCEQHNIESAIIPKKEKKKGKEKKIVITDIQKTADENKKPTTYQSTYGLFKEGKTVQEIATERNLAVQTIEGHLSAFIEKGLININELMKPERYNEIVPIMKEESEKTLTEIKTIHPQLEYGEMKMVLAALAFEKNK